MVNLDKLLTPQALAKKLDKEPNYLAKLRCSGDGPEFLKVMGRIYYEEAAVQAWLETKRRTSTSDPGVEPVPLTVLGSPEHRLAAPSRRQRKKALQLRDPDSYFGRSAAGPEAA